LSSRLRFKVKVVGEKTEDDPIRPAVDIHELAAKGEKAGRVTAFYRYTADLRECEVIAEIEDADTADFLSAELRKKGIAVKREAR